RARGPDPGGDVLARPHQAYGRLGDHLGRAAVAGVLVALHRCPQFRPVSVDADEDHVEEAGLSLFLAGPLAGPGAALAAQPPAGRLGHAPGRLFARGDDHLVVDEVDPIGMAHQGVRTVNVLGVDRRHYEWSHPGVHVRVVLGRVARRLRRPLEAGNQAERAGENL